MDALHRDLTDAIIGCGIRVHEVFRAGLYESVYSACMIMELHDAGLHVEQQRRVPLVYRGRRLGKKLIVDLVVNQTVLIELKTVEALAVVHTAQVITYLKLTGLPVGLLMNFNVPRLKDGIRRLVRPDLYVPAVPHTWGA